MSKPNAIIFDLDGTLANINHRIGYISKAKPDWKTFNSLCYKDTVQPWAKYFLDMFRMYQSQIDDDLKLIIVSGRDENCKYDTIDWLRNNFIDYFELCMRSKGDFRSDDIIKEEIYLNHIKPRFNVLFCVDDRKRVVDMWRRNGLVCLQCAEGNF